MTSGSSSSYRRHESGNDCASLGGHRKFPCWGQVEIVDCFNSDEEGEDEACIYACRGHADKIKYGFRAKYIKEDKHGAANA